MDLHNKIITKEILFTECAPYINRPTCADNADLQKIMDVLKLKKAEPKKIIDEAMKKTDCDSEICIFKKVDLPLDKFRPQGPKDNSWLSNFDIDDTLKQYMVKFSNFYAHKYEMRDFSNTGSDLNNIQWDLLLSKNKTKFACPLNTDTSKGPGQHWVSFFVDIENFTVEYFDSAAGPVPDEFNEWMTTNLIKIQKINPKAKLVFNNQVQHQTGGSECGVYTLYYILSRIHGISYDAFLDANDKVRDNVMTEFRSYIFT